MLLARIPAVVAAVGTALSLASAAHAAVPNVHHPQDRAAEARYRAWTAAAGRHVPVPARPIRVTDGPCRHPLAGEALACASTGPGWAIIGFPGDHDYIWTEPGREQAQIELRMIFLHELGHIADATAANRVSVRRAFLGAFYTGRRERVAWRSAPSWSRVSPSERFADAYALCAHDPAVPDLGVAAVNGYGYRPSTGRHQWACAIVGQLRFAG